LEVLFLSILSHLKNQAPLIFPFSFFFLNF